MRRGPSRPAGSPRVADERRKADRDAPADTAAGTVDFAQLLTDGLREIMGIRLGGEKGPASLEDLAPSTEPQPGPRRT